MKKLLFVGTIVASSWICPVHAQVATFDAANAVANAKSFLQDLKGYAQQLQSYEQDLRAYVQYVQTAQQALTIAQGIVHDPTNFGAYLSLGNLAGVNLQSSMPIDPYSLMALTSGYSGAGINGFMGKLNNLTNLVHTNAGVNAVNTCTANTFACQMQTQRQYAAAGQQAAAQQAVQDMNNHLTALTALKARCLSSPDAKDSSDCGNQIQVETAAIQADTAQLQAVQSMAAAQQTVFDNRASEWMKNGNAASHAAFAAAQGGGG